MDEDDDFGDFGGFEAAEPLAQQEAQQASPSPWAVFSAPTVPAVQPDGTPAEHPDTQDTNGTVCGVTSTGMSDAAQASGGSPWTGASNGQCDNISSLPGFDAKFDTDFDLDEPKQAGVSSAPLPDEISAPLCGVATSGISEVEKESPVSTSALSTGALSNGFEHEVIKEPDPISVSVAANLPSSESGISLELDTPEEPAVNIAETSHFQQSLVTEESSSPPTHTVSEPKVSLKPEDRVAEVPGKLSLAGQEKARIQKVDRVEIKELTKKNTELESELQIQKERLDEQIQKYDSVQAQHSEVLKDLRKAGHDALSVIVEEYKEVVKVALLQQHESCEKALQEALKLEAEKCEQLMVKQQERFVVELDEMRKSLNQKMEEALEDQSKKYQSTLELALKEEQEKCQESFQASLEEQNLANQKALEEAVSAEREKSFQMLQKQRESMKAAIAEEKSKVVLAVQSAVEEERGRAEEIKMEAVAAERKRGEEQLKESLKAAREEMKSYVQEQRQADHAVRRRALTSIDLFMEGAKKQLNLLLTESVDQNESITSDS